MPQLSRRLFLMRSSLAAAAVAAAPGLVNVLGSAGADAQAADAAVPGTGAALAGTSAGDVVSVASSEEGLSEPLVAHVKDLSTGEISIFNGFREIVTHDPKLAGSLYRAAR